MSDTIYSNAARIRTSLHDVAIDFGLQTPVDENDPLKTVVVSKVTVLLPPSQVRTIVNILTSHLAQYERDFGPIPGKDKAPAPAGPADVAPVEH